MDEVRSVPIVAALWLGLLTSISPCPLATNLAALGIVLRQVKAPGRVMLSGIVYTLGRALAYLLIAVAVVSGLLAIPATSYFLQHHLHRLLGPLLVVVGAVVLELVPLPVPSNRLGGWTAERAERWGDWSALILGFVFALSFCPVSAALYFGALIPLCARGGFYFHYPLLFGIGTAIPVVILAVALARGVHAAGAWLNRLSQMEKVFRMGTGVLLIGLGIYLSGSVIFHLW
ncbi:MAG: cytochrome c biogenesis protein [Armatimonadota bacterium]|nr:MAG: cytochrome c biogenesis protein [Armatimonadota bacterium]